VRPDPRVAQDRDQGDDDGLFESPWLWVGAGTAVAAAAAVVVVVIATSSTQADPVSGDTSPPTIMGRVVRP
jgi:hypothetical protein